MALRTMTCPRLQLFVFVGKARQPQIEHPGRRPTPYVRRRMRVTARLRADMPVPATRNASSARENSFRHGCRRGATISSPDEAWSWSTRWASWWRSHSADSTRRPRSVLGVGPKIEATGFIVLLGKSCVLTAHTLSIYDSCST